MTVHGRPHFAKLSVREANRIRLQPYLLKLCALLFGFKFQRCLGERPATGGNWANPSQRCVASSCPNRSSRNDAPVLYTSRHTSE